MLYLCSCAFSTTPLYFTHQYCRAGKSSFPVFWNYLRQFLLNYIWFRLCLRLNYVINQHEAWALDFQKWSPILLLLVSDILCFNRQHRKASFLWRERNFTSHRFFPFIAHNYVEALASLSPQRHTIGLPIQEHHISLRTQLPCVEWSFSRSFQLNSVDN